MSKHVLTDAQEVVLRKALAALAVKERTGELGVVHGLDRFVSSQVILKGEERKTLDALAGQLGTAIRRAPK